MTTVTPSDRVPTIPFNRSSVVGKEHAYIAEAMAIGQIAGDQRFGRKCEAILQKELSAPRVLLTTSCTHALELSAMLLNIQSGDEVIVPSFTFVSSANAFAIRGAKIVFADVLPDTLNVSPEEIARRITERTKAIVVVHYAGIACEMEEILELADRRGIPVIEDNAHGLFGRWRGRPLGTFGAMATQSFHETKNFTCGEGGALVLHDEKFVERAEILREKGTNRSRFFRGMVDRYTWVDFGSSYVMSDILGAFLFGQLEQRDLVQERRRRIWEIYDCELRDLVAAAGGRTPTVPNGAEQAYHMYYLLLPDLETRQALIAHLRAAGIMAVFHYLPLHLSDMGRSFGGRPGDCPVAEKISDRLVRLPFYFTLTEGEQACVCQEVACFLAARSASRG